MEKYDSKTSISEKQRDCSDVFFYKNTPCIVKNTVPVCRSTFDISQCYLIKIHHSSKPFVPSNKAHKYTNSERTK